MSSSIPSSDSSCWTSSRPPPGSRDATHSTTGRDRFQLSDTQGHGGKRSPVVIRARASAGATSRTCRSGSSASTSSGSTASIGDCTTYPSVATAPHSLPMWTTAVRGRPPGTVTPTSSVSTSRNTVLTSTAGSTGSARSSSASQCGSTCPRSAISRRTRRRTSTSPVSVAAASAVASVSTRPAVTRPRTMSSRLAAASSPPAAMLSTMPATPSIGPGVGLSTAASSDFLNTVSGGVRRGLGRPDLPRFLVFDMSSDARATLRQDRPVDRQARRSHGQR